MGEFSCDIKTVTFAFFLQNIPSFGEGFHFLWEIAFGSEIAFGMFPLAKYGCIFCYVAFEFVADLVC